MDGLRRGAVTKLAAGIRPRASSPGGFLCGACRGQSIVARRSVSTASPPPPPPPSTSTSTPTSTPSPVPSSGLAALDSRRIVSITGPDATKYLHGAVTATLLSPDGLPRSDGFYAAFLTAQGRVLHDVFVYPRILAGEVAGYWVEVDAGQAASLVAHVRRYRLRARFDVRLLDAGEAKVWHAWGERSDIRAGAGVGSGDCVAEDTRAPGHGWRVVREHERRPALDVEQVPEPGYQLRRYLHGVPEGQAEMLHGAALPLESNLDLMGAIDFRKGCYVGQELTIRTRHRGVVRKRILPCVLYPLGADPPPSLPSLASLATTSPSASASSSSSTPQARAQDLSSLIAPEASIGRAARKGRSVGRWLAGRGNLGLALCRLEAMTDVVLPGEVGGGSRPGEEFVLGGEGEGEGEPGVGVGVRAFVPEFVRRGLQPEDVTRRDE